MNRVIAVALIVHTFQQNSTRLDTDRLRGKICPNPLYLMNPDCQECGRRPLYDEKSKTLVSTKDLTKELGVSAQFGDFVLDPLRTQRYIVEKRHVHHAEFTVEEARDAILAEKRRLQIEQDCVD